MDRVCEKYPLRSLGLLGERNTHMGVEQNDSDRATAQSQAFTAREKLGLHS